MSLKPMEFEVVWIDESDDFRPSRKGNLVLCPIIEVEPIRRRSLTAALIYAGNAMRKHPTARGFYVRRKR